MNFVSHKLHLEQIMLLAFEMSEYPFVLYVKKPLEVALVQLYKVQPLKTPSHMTFTASDWINTNSLLILETAADKNDFTLKPISGCSGAFNYFTWSSSVDKVCPVVIKLYMLNFTLYWALEILLTEAKERHFTLSFNINWTPNC